MILMDEWISEWINDYFKRQAVNNNVFIRSDDRDLL